MRSFAGTMPRGVSPSSGAKNIMHDVKSKATSATNTFKDSVVSKASTAVDKASVVVGVASDVAKQGVAMSRQAIDSVKERLDVANGLAKQGAVIAKDRLDTARHAPEQQAAIPAESPAKRAASKAMLKGEQVKTSLKLAQASTLDVKRRAEAFVKSKFSKETLVPKDANQSPDSLGEFSESNGECQEIDCARSPQPDYEPSASDAVVASSTTWSLRPSVGTWLLQFPFAEEELSAAEVSNDASVSNTSLPATDEEEAQIETSDAIQEKTRLMEQTSGVKAMPVRGGA